MDRDTRRIWLRLSGQWNEIKAALQQMSSNVDVRPDSEWEIFRASDVQPADAIEFVVNPVTFSLPERASHVAPDLFVVVEGRLAVDRDAVVDGEELITREFATRA